MSNKLNIKQVRNTMSIMNSKASFISRLQLVILFSVLLFNAGFSQVTVNINSGNPNHPFPQFYDYKGGTSLATQNGVGVPHAEMEQRTRDAYQMLTNTLTYNVTSGGVTGPLTVAGVKYISPKGAVNQHCTCVEGDGYNLLAAAYMADKATFDGYYMWVHDRQLQKTRRFVDCVMNSPAYAYAPGISGAGSFGSGVDVKGGALGGNSATDGDDDLSMALLVAWKQWGDNGVICIDPCTGNPITYKDEAIRYIKTMVDTVLYPLNLVNYTSGVIGFDGYHKSGDSWGEATNWAAGGYKGMKPETGVDGSPYVDYAAPAYWETYAEMLTAEGESPWCIEQYKRAEASDDWLVGQNHAKGNITWAGKYTVDATGTTTTFSNFMASEDNRFAWRTHLNYLWNGPPTRTWDPATHEYTVGSNTYEYDAAMRMATFMKNPEAAPYNNTCFTSLTGMQYGGPPNVKWQYNPDGTGGGAFPLNWAHGTSAPAACISGDRNLMAQMFRQCVIEWDQQNGSAQQYLTSMPRYFHDWNRLLGMIILGGNLPDPMDMDEKANMKVYVDVDKTYASSCDEVTYEISYRNYGKKDATNVTINDLLPAGLTYVSSTIPATVSGNSVTFNIGTVPGFKTGGLAATKGVFSLKVKVGQTATGRLCNVATITCSNGSGWTSNEYPNNDTPVMERNCVDILSEAPLTIRKTASKTELHPGDTVSYTIVVKNSSVAFLNGGRPGVIVAGSHDGLSAAASTLRLRYRVYHGAEEAYINYENYRASYYLNKPGPPAWTVDGVIKEGVPTYPSFTQQNIPIGPTWNHRFILTFPNQLATITPFIDYYAGMTAAIHQGAVETMRVAVDVHDAGYANYNWTTDWSSEPGTNAADGAVYWPVANDWTDPLMPNQPVLKYHPNNCSNNVTKTITKQLIEEWDGYTWRRIYGDAPISGRELNNVQVTDVLPAGVTFGGYFTGYPTGVLAGSTITWPTIANMKINDSTIYKFWVTVDGACPMADFTLTNIATATALNECPESDTAIVTATCNPIIVVPPVTSMKKTANATSYNVGDPITYTIGYKNTHGTVVNTATVAADWTDVIGAGKLSVNGSGDISMNSSWTSKGMTYKYSHGTNGVVKGTATFAQYAGPYSIIVRHNGATWTEIRFKVDNANVQVSYFNMPANTQIGSTQTITYGALPGAFDFQIQLVGAVANVWLVNAGAAIVGAAPITANIPIQAGYAGVRSQDGNATSKLTNWYTSLDSGFDQQMVDAIPAEVTYVSASNSGSNVAGTVTWPKVAGPILAGDSITYTWTGTVSSCSGGTITNTAYVKMMGIVPDPGAQNIVTCSGTNPPLDPGKIGSNQTICYDAIPSLFTNIILATGGSGTYSYQWQVSTDSTAWTDIAAATDTVYTSIALTTTSWFRRKVTAGGAPAYTLPVKVIVYNPLTGGTVASDQTICYNATPAAFTSTTTPTGGTGVYTYQWQSSADSTVWTDVVGEIGLTYTPASALTAKTYYRRVTTSGVCGQAYAPVTVDVYSKLISGTIGSDQSICKNKIPAAFTELTASTGGTGSYTYQWQTSSDDITYSDIASATSATYTSSALGVTTYFKRKVSSGTCGTDTSAFVKITILPSDSAKVLPAGPFCNSDPATTIKLTGGSTGGGVWSGLGITNTSSGAFDPSLLALGTYKIKYTTLGACPASDSIDVVISNGVSLSITSATTTYCQHGVQDTIEVNTPGGVFWTSSGKGMTDVNFGYFDPNLSDIGIDTIWYGKAGQCGDTAFIEISVIASDTAKITVGQAFCASEGIVLLAKEGISAAGTWSGTGITDGTTGSFNAGTGEGDYLITYTTSGTCPVQDTATVHVYGQMIADITSSDTTLCGNASAQQINLSPTSTAGGMWLSSPTPGLVSGSGVFDPTASGVGVFKIYYIVSGATLGCSAADSITYTVSTVETAKITLGQGPYCKGDPIQFLQTDPGTDLGTWSGTGITNANTGEFTPSTAVVGANLITYTTNGACWVEDTLTVVVVDQMISDITTTDTTVCANALPVQIALSSTSTGGGTWSSSPTTGLVSGTGVFDPNAAGAGVYKIYYELGGGAATCGAKDSVEITVSAMETAKITLGQGPYCKGDPIQMLQTDAGTDAGTWSGTGITNTATGEFTPLSAMVGANLITYTTGGTCNVEDTLTIIVVDQMIADITTIDTAVCANALPVQIALSSTSTGGGTWSSSPTTGLVSGTGVFDPSSAGVGTYKIYYELTGATATCSAKDSVEIIVSPMETATITLGQGPFCESDGVQLLQTDAGTDAGIWIGTGISDINTGAFTPSSTVVGANLVTYTTNGTCWVQDTLTIVVVDKKVVDIVETVTPLCEDDASLYQIELSSTTSPNGIWSSVPAGYVNGAGQFDATAATAGSSYWIYHEVMGGTTSCGAKDSIEITVVQREDATITTVATSMCSYDAPITLTSTNGGGVWSGTGVVQPDSFDPSVTGTTTTTSYDVTYILAGLTGQCPDTQTVSITVVNMDATLPQQGPYCVNLDTLKLTSNTGGGVFSGTGVDATGIFDPSVAGVGTSTITYTQTDGVCTWNESIQIEVNAVPDLRITPDVIQGCMPLHVTLSDSSNGSVLKAHWDFGDGETKDTTHATVSHIYDKAMNNLVVTLSVEFTNGCKNDTTIKGTIVEPPVADFIFDPLSANSLDPNINFFNQSTGASSFLWNFTSQGLPDTSHEFERRVWFDTPNGDTLPVTLIAKNDFCADTIVKDVYIKGNFTLYIPNAFTPNGDGKNDVFFPDGINHVCDDCKNYNFSIFNRWGELIFSTSTPYEAWNGKRSNTMRDAEIDVYVWKLSYTNSFNGKPGGMIGRVTLMR